MRMVERAQAYVVQADGVPWRNLHRLSRVYGATTWDVYERLDVSLNPTGRRRRAVPGASTTTIATRPSLRSITS